MELQKPRHRPRIAPQNRIGNPDDFLRLRIISQNRIGNHNLIDGNGIALPTKNGANKKGQYVNDRL